ncbi:MAG: hypothetical protein ACFFCM_13470 [Promethearchaeota archaeon]
MKTIKFRNKNIEQAQTVGEILYNDYYINKKGILEFYSEKMGVIFEQSDLI